LSEGGVNSPKREESGFSEEIPKKKVNLSFRGKKDYTYYKRRKGWGLGKV